MQLYKYICTFLLTHPMTTIKKSKMFHPFLRYEPLCNRNPYAIIFITHSAVNITKNTYSIFSCNKNKTAIYDKQQNPQLIPKPDSSHQNHCMGTECIQLERRSLQKLSKVLSIRRVCKTIVIKTIKKIFVTFILPFDDIYA